VTPEDLIELEPPSSDETPPRKPRRLWILTAVLALAALAILAAIGPLTWQVLSQKGATLTMPVTIGTLNRDDSAAAKDTARDLVSALRAEIDLDATAGAIYADPAGGPAKTVMLFGGTALLWSPEKELDTVMSAIAGTGEPLKGLSEVDAGPLGGVMKCGVSGGVASDDPAMAVCGWADHGSLAMALFPGRTPADAAVLMRQLRAATLTR
jgi:hypothetical protein